MRKVFHTNGHFEVTHETAQWEEAICVFRMHLRLHPGCILEAAYVEAHWGKTL